MYDPHPSASSSTLPPAFNLSSRGRKDQVAAGQRAELDHILQPGFKSTLNDSDRDSSSIAGTSRQNGIRTAGGLAGAKKTNGIRASPSVGSLRPPNSAGIYVDSSGKVHDTEFDPFAGVAELSRRKSRRRSAFGQDRRRRGSGSSSSSGERSDASRRSVQTPTGETKDEGEIRKRLEMERRRLDDVSGYAAARRRSIVSERSSGRGTPSIRSAEESVQIGGRAKSSQDYYVRSPLSPSFGAQTSASSAATTRTLPTTVEIADGSPANSTKISIGPDKKVTITGFNAPRVQTPTTAQLKAPDTGRMSATSRTSSDRPPKPAERPREELFPDTPAQVKRREERSRRMGQGGMNRGASLAVDTVISTGDRGRGRILPEIEIVEDDDPRIVFPADGPFTRLQSTHDHVIRGPFAFAMDANGMRRGSADHSARSMVGSTTKAPSTIIEEGGGGYLPSRWAGGDHALRRTEDEKEKYRPTEWGGRKGDLAGRTEGWKWVENLLLLCVANDHSGQRVRIRSTGTGRISRRMRGSACSGRRRSCCGT